MTELTIEQIHNYINETIIPSFLPIVNEKIFSVIYGLDYKVIICTNQSAKSLGANTWQEVQGSSYKYYNDPEMGKHYFKEAYTDKTAEAIHRHAKKIVQVQQFVMKKGKIVSFIDLLPYNNMFKSYLTTYAPLFHPTKNVVALQSFTVESRFFGFQDHFSQIKDNFPPSRIYTTAKNLTVRELEILFLLANGVTQEQIAQILNISRSTVATIISSQLCSKFGISGSSTKLLSEAAIKNGYYQHVPPSLWQPNIIILDEELAKQINDFPLIED